MSVNVQHFLCVTAVGTDRIGVLEAFTKICKQCGCNILDSKLTSIGEECVLLFYLAGTWNTIAKLEAALPVVAQKQGFSLQIKRTSSRKAFPAFPYQVQIVGQDRVGLLNEMAAFFKQQGISVDKMDCETYMAKCQTLMTSLTFLIYVPAKHHIASLRERFMNYCDDRNLDAVMEPFKHSA